MAKVEIFKKKHTGDLAEIERTATDADRSKERGKAPNIISPPSAKSAPPIVPTAAAAARLAGVSPISRRRPSLRTLLMAAGILVVLVSSAVFWLRGGRYASTDDAYVQAAQVLVTTDVSGLVKSVDVREGQAVKTGDPLFRLDPLPFQIALDGANANLRETALTIESMKELINFWAEEQSRVRISKPQRC